MPINRLFIPAVAVLGLVAIGLSASANAAAPTVLGAGHDQISAKGKSTFTLIFRGGYRGGAVGFRGYRGGFGRTYAFAGRRGFYGGYGVRRAYWGGGRYWHGAGWRRAGWYGGWRRPWYGGWGWRRAGWYGGWRRPWYGGWGWRRAGWYGGSGWPLGVGLYGYGYGGGSCF